MNFVRGAVSMARTAWTLLLHFTLAFEDISVPRRDPHRHGGLCQTDRLPRHAESRSGEEAVENLARAVFDLGELGFERLMIQVLGGPAMH